MNEIYRYIVFSMLQFLNRVMLYMYDGLIIIYLTRSTHSALLMDVLSCHYFCPDLVIVTFNL